MKNDKGFVMVMMVLIIMVLMVLGGVAVSTSMISYKMKLTNTRAQQNFYISESGLDELYAIVRETVADGLDKANSELDEFYKDFVYDEEINNAESEFIDEKGSFNKEYLTSYCEKLFKKEYKRYIKKNIFKDLNQDNFVLDFDGNKTNVKINCQIRAFINDKMSLKVTSSSKGNATRKTISAEIDILVPQIDESDMANNKSLVIDEVTSSQPILVEYPILSLGDTSVDNLIEIKNWNIIQ